MKKNTVQFQKRFSLLDFFKTYGREEQSEKALFDWRWPRGFVCPECGHTHYCLLNTNRNYSDKHPITLSPGANQRGEALLSPLPRLKTQ
ncbi:MAG: transposase [Candidatus Thiodiazotropha sp. (ex Lucinoma aequizonata)]|nr:transposase [Candidatus Thiodiazotropha sp. (ex Lucinoma aequizonata)]MCU7890056.1 transposase [Candidatus Thiodiazotropha sp. (ex Lucinoma aequizonata)]MCU7896223.1 transposase [Candidatus Thiodiazotropha sp. (ex Lucinoma aequizonata)]MCU7898626.1 transposase [Candidatus Thiodiazotropha sp. (ex Lucinoma aequizonata)]MCU7902576.1 transposase [Candidatus Thiodiazotropha sp. (ex Lucinoma aequizonata)]